MSEEHDGPETDGAPGTVAPATKVELAKGVTITSDEANRLFALVSSELRANATGNVFAQLLHFNEVLAACVDNKVQRREFLPTTTSSDSSNADQILNELKKWSGEAPTFFEVRLLRILCYRNFVWPELSAKTDAVNADQAKANKLLFSAMGSALFGKMELPKLGKVDLEKARRHKIRKLSPDVEEIFVTSYLTDLASQVDGTVTSQLSFISSNNNRVGNLLTALTYAKAVAMLEKSDQIDAEMAQRAVDLVANEQAKLEELADSAFSMIDSGLASPRLFNRLLAEAATTTST